MATVRATSSMLRKSNHSSRRRSKALPFASGRSPSEGELETGSGAERTYVFGHEPLKARHHGGRVDVVSIATARQKIEACARCFMPERLCFASLSPCGGALSGAAAEHQRLSDGIA